MTAAERDRLKLDAAQMVLAIAGIVDPTPISDGTNTAISLARGHWGEAAINAIGIIPYAGDLAKVDKLGKFGDTVVQIASAVRTSPEFANLMKPVLSQLKTILGKVPVDQLPAKVEEAVSQLGRHVDDALGSAGKAIASDARAVTAGDSVASKAGAARPAPKHEDAAGSHAGHGSGPRNPGRSDGADHGPSRSTGSHPALSPLERRGVPRRLWRPKTPDQRAAATYAYAEARRAGAGVRQARFIASETTRAVAQRESIDVLRARTSQMTPEKARVVEQQIAVFDRALMSLDVYKAGETPGLLPAGYRRLSPEEVHGRFGLDAHGMQGIGRSGKTDGSGYFAAMYEYKPASGGPSKLFYVNRGSEYTYADFGKTNIPQFLGLRTVQYSRAIENARTLKAAGADVEFVGHSLGGGLAYTQGVSTGLRSSSFNPAAVNDRTIRDYLTPASRTPPGQVAYVVRGEVVNGLQDFLGRSPIGRVGDRIAGRQTNVIVPRVPVVRHERITLPAVRRARQMEESIVDGSGMGRVRAMSQTLRIHHPYAVVDSIAHRLNTYR